MTNHVERLYEERLLTFIDLCGFGEMINETVTGTRRVGELYALMNDVTSLKIINTVYGGIPTLGLDVTRELKPAGELAVQQCTETCERAQESWPIVVTHFSDSFVISSPAANVGSTRLHLQLVRALVLGFIRIGIVIRGGMTAGGVIHERAGAVFGPAMNRAYQLESKKAEWPRILVDAEAFSVIQRGDDFSDPLRELIQPHDIGLWQITPASCCLIGCDPKDQASHRTTLDGLAEKSKVDSKLAQRFERLMANWHETLPDVDGGST